MAWHRWETRRHNKEPADWVIIKVGAVVQVSHTSSDAHSIQLGVASGTVHGIEVDTAFFNGNHAPAVTVEGTFTESGSLDANTEVCFPPLQRWFKRGLLVSSGT